MTDHPIDDHETPEGIQARQEYVRELMARATTMTESVLPPIARETFRAIGEAARGGESDDIWDVLTVGLKKAYYEGFQFGRMDLVAELVEQGYDELGVTRIRAEDLDL